MKHIRIQDDLYQLLDDDGKKNIRNIQAQLEFVLRDYYKVPPVKVETDGSPAQELSNLKLEQTIYDMKLRPQGIPPHEELKYYNPVIVPITPRNKDMEFCKHGAVKGLCKKGCK